MTGPNVNPSPKQRFLAIKRCVDQHRELIERPDFQLSVDHALAQMAWTQSSEGNPTFSVSGNIAAERFYRIQGAHEFVRTLKTLAEVSAPLPIQETGQISHEFK